MRQAGPATRTMLATPLLREGTPIGRHRRRRRPEVQPVLGQADRAARDLRRPGGDRDRERAAVQGAGGAEPRADRGARAADGHGRDPAGDRQLADRPPAGVRRHRRERRRGCAAATLRRRLPRSTASCSASWRATDRIAEARASCVERVPDRRRAASRARRGPSSSARSIHVADVERGPGVSRSRATAHGRSASGAVLAVPLLREGEPIGAIVSLARRGPGRSPTSRSRCSRPSPTRRSSPSRTCGCSRNSRRGRRD